MKQKSFRLIRSVLAFFMMFSLIGYTIATPLSIKAVGDEKDIALNK